jgi:phytoene synthase
MQLTNILRDIEEDAARGRLYVPREFLRAGGIDSADPSYALAHPGFLEAWRMLRDYADAAFAQARAALAACPKPRRLWPALVMMGVYGRVLRAVAASGLRPGERVRVGLATQLWVAVQVLVSARA